MGENKESNINKCAPQLGIWSEGHISHQTVLPIRKKVTKRFRCFEHNKHHSLDQEINIQTEGSITSKALELVQRVLD